MSRFDAMGSGSPPRRWRGRWRASLTVGYNRDGKPLRKYVYGATQAECREKFEQLKKDREANRFTHDDPPLSVWLEHWFEVQSARWRPRTVEVHRVNLTRLGNHVLRKPLSKVRALDIEREALMGV